MRNDPPSLMIATDIVLDGQLNARAEAQYPYRGHNLYSRFFSQLL
jgi:hypothetical protein